MVTEVIGLMIAIDPLFSGESLDDRDFCYS